VPESSTRDPSHRSSGGERVFTDALGRLWSASYVADEAGGGAVMFTCVSEVRQSSRAIAARLPEGVEEVEEGTLRAWLEKAPRIGTLT
jgi:hypothetical protein